ncbi:MAG TPA: ABC-ATPase domain-containing protein [Enorma massiliensis]|uniref:ABC-ATPase domain-containing protein n=1 Tax=Enorma massiliensis TaxID=1472761 RepID=UPI001D525D35|nr:ABC-ATPase domain-containing protein [Enorma massiliensis]HJG62665.1 ABC-ATPase domain-containing protein [Enorma massiliensis]
MKTDRDLERQLASIDRRGYPAYKGLRGTYDFGDFELDIAHVQGDPFAAPSQLAVYVPGDVSGLPACCRDAAHRRTATEDLLVRRFSKEAARASFKVGGSGKSGFIGTSNPGPEILERSACEIAPDGAVTLRFEAGLPAHGRTIDARAAARMLLDLIPVCVERALMLDDAGRRAAQKAAELADDQRAVRSAMRERGLVAFVADGSVLPRSSGASAKPLAGAQPFTSPESMRVTLELPHRGRVRGMGIRRGITLIVGGGYHGKSTLLKALQEGVYDHIAGDGRELVATDETAMKLRAEDGRVVHAVDISPFINNLPDGRDTRSFSTEDASGSTSQAASTVEALEAGARTLLIDEDTSATNFMVRDALMEAVVAAEHEPIMPFVERVRALWERHGVSCVLVMGSSGAFFPVADSVIQMDAYEANDITERVRAVLADARLAGTYPEVSGLGVSAGEASEASEAGEASASSSSVQDTLVSRSLELGGKLERRSTGRPGRRGRAGGGDGAGTARHEHLKVRGHGRDGFSVGSFEADLRLVEQLVDAEQSAALAQMVRMVLEHGLLDGTRALRGVVDEAFRVLDEQGWEALSPYGDTACGLARPRPCELFAALNRLR